MSRKLFLPAAAIGLALMAGVSASPASAHGWGRHHHHNWDNGYEPHCYSWYDYYGNYHQRCEGYRY
jgi:hypothetical protein